MTNKEYRESNIEQKSHNSLLLCKYDLSLSTSKIVLWGLIQNVIELSGIPVDLNIIFYMYTKLNNKNGNLPTINDIVKALLFVKTAYYSDKKGNLNEETRHIIYASRYS